MSVYLKAPSNQVEAIEQPFPHEHHDEVQPASADSEEETDALANGGVIVSDEQDMAVAAFDKESVDAASSLILPIGGAETEEAADFGQEQVNLASDSGADTPVVAKDQPSNPIVLLKAEEGASKPKEPPEGMVDDANAKSNRSDTADIPSNEAFEDAGGSSMDSDDLMMEADAMADLQDAAVKNQATVAEQTSRQRKTERMDSSVLLADFDQLEARGHLPTAQADTNEEGDE